MIHRQKMQWTTVGTNMAILSTLVVCDDMCHIIHYVAGRQPVHMTTEYSATAICFKTLPNISPISSTYLVIQLMNAALLLLVLTRNHRDPPSIVNKKCSTRLYQSHGMNLNMQLICGKAGFPGYIVYQ